MTVCVASFLIKMWQYHPCVSEQKTKEKRKKEKKERKILDLFCRFTQLRERTSGTERNIINGFAVNLTTGKFPSLCFFLSPSFWQPPLLPLQVHTNKQTTIFFSLPSFLLLLFTSSIYHSTSVARNIPSFLSPMPPDIFGSAVFVVLIIIIYYYSSSYYYCCYC